MRPTSKTDGSYIYHVSGERVVIAKTYPSEEMKVVGTLDFTGKEFSPRAMYVDDKHLVVTGLAGEPEQTKVYKFAMNGGRLTYTASGEVPGAVLNQFTMDEHDGCFRIATTKGDVTLRLTV